MIDTLHPFPNEQLLSYYLSRNSLLLHLSKSNPRKQVDQVEKLNHASLQRCCFLWSQPWFLYFWYINQLCNSASICLKLQSIMDFDMNWVISKFIQSIGVFLNFKDFLQHTKPYHMAHMIPKRSYFDCTFVMSSWHASLEFHSCSFLWHPSNFCLTTAVMLETNSSKWTRSQRAFTFLVF